MEFDEELFRIHSEFCACFTNITRLKIFFTLQSGEQTVSDLAQFSGASIQNTSQHLRLLKDKGAVTTRKDGKQIYYSITNDKFIKGAKLIREGVIEEFQKRSKALI